MNKTNSLKELLSRRQALASLVMGLMVGTIASPPAFGGGTAKSYSGRAVVVSANVLGVPVVVSDTGPLPDSGGAREASLLNVNLPGLLSAEVCHAVTIGQGGTSYAEASTANAGLTAGGNTVSAVFVHSWAAASCCATLSVSGGSELVGLVINGQAIAVNGQPNQTVQLPNGKVIINEQVTEQHATSGSITVNALHIIVNGVADVVVCSSHADVVCGGDGQPPACGDFITGGGWITGTPSGAKGNFGVAGGLKNGALWGHLNYIDHGNGMHVKHTAVTGYSTDPNDADCRIIAYNVTINGSPGTATVRVCDKGEPGRNDVFEIRLSNGYAANGQLGGGNIQLHTCQ